MSACIVDVAFDAWFAVPDRCLKEGHVTCQVLDADCRIIEEFHGKVIFQVKLLVKLTIRSGGLLCAFERVIVIRERVRLDRRVSKCDVKAVSCRCKVSRGRVLCSGIVAVKFPVSKKKDWCDCFH